MFQFNQNSLDVIKNIVETHPQISEIVLIAHSVQTNWRQQNRTNDAKRRDIAGALHQEKPTKVLRLTRQELADLTIEDLSRNSSIVWSFTSRAFFSDGSVAHIPMMNFHPEKGVSVDDVKKLAIHISNNREGVLLNSGRYFHYYGNYLLSQDEWRVFMSKFLMPCVFVSPRYVGHRLQDNYATLRITSHKKYKPTIPFVVEIF